MIIYIHSDSESVAYVQEPGGGKYEHITGGTAIEKELVSVIYALNEFFLAWNRELDERQDNMDSEQYRGTGEVEFGSVATPASQTPRPLPPPVEIRSSNLRAVEIYNNLRYPRSTKQRKLLDNIKSMTKNLQVRIVCIPEYENEAIKLARKFR